MRQSAERRLPADRGSVVTVGTFDGVHRGHSAILDEITRRADASGRRSVLLTFEPHPLYVVRPEQAPGLLTTRDEKKELLAQSGIDVVVFQAFTSGLASFSPERFVDEVLVRRLALEELVIGYDHGFGRNRSGDAETLRAIGASRGFTVDVVDPVTLGPDPISSSRIRAAVAAGRLDEARSGLGRSYGVTGTVTRGDGRGRSIGFPTANLSEIAPEKLLPPPGVYAVRVDLAAGPMRVGALHLGPRPTFEGAEPTLEVHLLDFEGDLYGQRLRVHFVEQLRGIRRFESVADLTAQLQRDVAAAGQRVSLDG
jgi:riboflavin kinase/FMN adenylyltransferase